MKIEKRWTVQFSDLVAGQVFDYAGDIYLRVDEVRDGDKVYNAVDLGSGLHEYFTSNYDVTLYQNAKVVLI